MGGAGGNEENPRGGTQKAGLAGDPCGSLEDDEDGGGKPLSPGYSSEKGGGKGGQTWDFEVKNCSNNEMSKKGGYLRSRKKHHLSCSKEEGRL